MITKNMGLEVRKTESREIIQDFKIFFTIISNFTDFNKCMDKYLFIISDSSFKEYTILEKLYNYFLDKHDQYKHELHNINTYGNVNNSSISDLQNDIKYYFYTDIISEYVEQDENLHAIKLGYILINFVDMCYLNDDVDDKLIIMYLYNQKMSTILQRDILEFLTSMCNDIEEYDKMIFKYNGIKSIFNDCWNLDLLRYTEIYKERNVIEDIEN